jgi:aldehyde dehydrogenase (NAD+)
MTIAPTPASAVGFQPEPRMFIDGRLRDASSGQVVDNINPATEEILGVAADAAAEDMAEAIAAARSAFDTTDWSTNPNFRRHCLHQLHDALQDEKEDIRAELVAEAGAPLSSTYIAQLDWPLADAVHWPAELISRFPWERMLSEDAKLGVPYNRVVVKEPIGVVGAITPWNFPFEIISNKMGQAPGHRQHDGAQACHRNTVERAALGPNHRREDRHPRRRGQHRAHLGQRRRATAAHRLGRRHDLIHRVDRRR